MHFNRHRKTSDSSWMHANDWNEKWFFFSILKVNKKKYLVDFSWKELMRDDHMATVLVVLLFAYGIALHFHISALSTFFSLASHHFSLYARCSIIFHMHIYYAVHTARTREVDCCEGVSCFIINLHLPNTNYACF